MKSCTDSQYFIHVSLSVARARSVMLLYHLETLPAPDPPPLNPQRNLHMEGRQLPQPCVSISCADFLDRVVFSFCPKGCGERAKAAKGGNPIPCSKAIGIARAAVPKAASTTASTSPVACGALSHRRQALPRLSLVVSACCLWNMTSR